MYEAHFRLREKPFAILPDPSFIFWSRIHVRAYTMLEYSILNNAGFTVITGEIGCGKTTLIRYLLSQVPDDLVVGVVTDTQVASGDLIRWVMLAFGQNFEQTSEVAAYRDFREYIAKLAAAGCRAVLVVDEAQNLPIDGLEKLRMLSNVNVEKQNALQIILVGQPQLREMLQRPELTQFMQRVSSEYNIDPLPAQDIKGYIMHRIGKAGSPVALFSDRAIQQIADESRGIPRLINILCDTALVYAYAKDAAFVDSRVMKHVVADRHNFGVFSRNSKPEQLKAE